MISRGNLWLNSRKNFWRNRTSGGISYESLEKVVGESLLDSIEETMKEFMSEFLQKFPEEFSKEFMEKT